MKLQQFYDARPLRVETSFQRAMVLFHLEDWLGDVVQLFALRCAGFRAASRSEIEVRHVVDTPRVLDHLGRPELVDLKVYTLWFRGVPCAVLMRYGHNDEATKPAKTRTPRFVTDARAFRELVTYVLNEGLAASLGTDIKVYHPDETYLDLGVLNRVSFKDLKNPSIPRHEDPQT